MANPKLVSCRTVVRSNSMRSTEPSLFYTVSLNFIGIVIGSLQHGVMTQQEKLSSLFWKRQVNTVVNLWQVFIVWSKLKIKFA